jgi:hypothetical protein
MALARAVAALLLAQVADQQLMEISRYTCTFTCVYVQVCVHMPLHMFQCLLERAQLPYHRSCFPGEEAFSQ